jgi:hypothetical protein
MTTMEADPNTSRLAAMRGSLTGAEWTRVAAMVGVIVALHLFGSAVVESYLHRGKRAHDGVLTNRIRVRVSRPGRARPNRALGAEQRQSRSPRTRPWSRMGREGGSQICA